MKEKLVQASIRRWLAERGWFVIKLHGSVMQFSGLPDLLCLKGGTYLWVEVKTEKGQLSKRQIYMQQVLRDHGAGIVTARKLEDVQEIVERGY